MQLSRPQRSSENSTQLFFFPSISYSIIGGALLFIRREINLGKRAETSSRWLQVVGADLMMMDLNCVALFLNGLQPPRPQARPPLHVEEAGWRCLGCDLTIGT